MREYVVGWSGISFNAPPFQNVTLSQALFCFIYFLSCFIYFLSGRVAFNMTVTSRIVIGFFSFCFEHICSPVYTKHNRLKSENCSSQHDEVLVPLTRVGRVAGRCAALVPQKKLRN